MGMEIEGGGWGWGATFDPAKARAAQKRLSRLVSSEFPAGPIETICGMDVAYRGNEGAGAAVVLSYPGLEVIETKTILGKAFIPYMPTFLAFREMPFLYKLFSRLDEEPSLFFINGHGVYHPAGLGLASHFGVAFGVPTIGVAGGLLRLKGQAVDGDAVYMSGRKVCCALRQKDENDGCRARGKVSYVSAGHRISLERAVEVARSCFREHSTPEPLFLADQISKKTIGSTGVYGQ